MRPPDTTTPKSATGELIGLAFAPRTSAELSSHCQTPPKSPPVDVDQEVEDERGGATADDDPRSETQNGDGLESYFDDSESDLQQSRPPAPPAAPQPPLRYTSFDGPHNDENEDEERCCMDEDAVGRACLDKSSQRHATKLTVAICVSSVFFLTELVGGIVAGSLALMSDSFHLLSDIVSFAIALLSIYLARRPVTKSHSYGYHRAEILGALVSIFLIWGLTGYLVIEAVDRIRNPQEVDGKTMCIVAALGVGVNVVLMLILHDHHHGHGHGHSHGHGHGHGQAQHREHALPHPHSLEEAQPLQENREDRGQHHAHRMSINLSAAFLHVLGDLLSSVGVLISSIVIIIDPKKSWVDPVCTFVFSVLVILTTLGVLRSTVRILMEATPSHINAHDVEDDLKGIKGVKDVHELHIWDLTVGRTSCTVHLQLQQYNAETQVTPPSPSVILAQARRLLRRKYGINKVTIQIDGLPVGS